MSTHVCELDGSDVCIDPDRDWCESCQSCTPWNGEVCAECGNVWGETA